MYRRGGKNNVLPSDTATTTGHAATTRPDPNGVFRLPRARSQPAF
jgi:hypothetical protein